MGTSTTHWTVLGAEHQRWEMLGAWGADLALLWHWVMPQTHQRDCRPPPSPVGLPSPLPHLFNILENWVNGSGALREGKLDMVHLLEPWQSHSCTHRALPEGSPEPDGQNWSQILKPFGGP